MKNKNAIAGIVLTTVVLLASPSFAAASDGSSYHSIGGWVVWFLDSMNNTRIGGPIPK